MYINTVVFGDYIINELGKNVLQMVIRLIVLNDESSVTFSIFIIDKEGEEIMVLSIRYEKKIFDNVRFMSNVHIYKINQFNEL